MAGSPSTILTLSLHQWGRGEEELEGELEGDWVEEWEGEVRREQGFKLETFITVIFIHFHSLFLQFFTCFLHFCKFPSLKGNK